MRYFLIDLITELEAGKYVKGIKNVTLSDEVLHDHFPDFPVMPGALIVEAASQLAGFLLEMTFNQPEKPLRRALLVQIDKAKFYEVAQPGDRLELTVRIDSVIDPAAQVSAQVEVEGKRIVRAQLTFVLKEIDSERIHEQRRYLYKLWTRTWKSPLKIL